MTAPEEDESFLQVVRCPVIAVIGPGDADGEETRAAGLVGKLLAEAGAAVVTGGLGGVMEAASRGAFQAGGTTIGILPGNDASESPPNPFVQTAVFTGMGDARNAIVVRTAGAVIAIGGSFGTLSEIGLALKARRPVVLYDSWEIRPHRPVTDFDFLVRPARSPQEAVALAVSLAASRG